MSEITQTIGGVVPEIWTESGVLLETSGSTETHVGGSIGTDRRGGTYGFVTSTTADRQKIWLKLADGSETWFRWTGFEVPIRQGHKITVVLVSDGRDSYVLGIVNHTTKEYFRTFSDPDEILRKIDANPKGIHWSVALATGLATLLLALRLADDELPAQILAWVAGIGLGPVFGGVAYYITGAFVDPGRRERLRVLVNNHCREELHKGFPDRATQGDSEQESSG